LLYALQLAQACLVCQDPLGQAGVGMAWPPPPLLLLLGVLQVQGGHLGLLLARGQLAEAGDLLLAEVCWEEGCRVGWEEGEG
jgi:hypothetical protein